MKEQRMPRVNKGDFYVYPSTDGKNRPQSYFSKQTERFEYMRSGKVKFVKLRENRSSDEKIEQREERRK